jgi:coenzyme F420-dependent glucose-6-phosphate dehydrogenase
MAVFGIHCSHEQHSPKELLEYAKLAEKCGFSSAMCSDHFHPWSEEQGESGFAWSWLGSALEATSLSFGTVCAPGQRYHPAIIAQAAATLAAMYEGRFWVALGSGEALNESITGEPWPSKETRNQRLRDCLQVIRGLLRGESVSFDGTVKVKEAKLFSRPTSTPLIFGAALTPETAKWMGPLFDGLITAGSDREGLKKVVSTFKENGGEGKPIYLQAAICYAVTKEEAMTTAHRAWRHAALALSEVSSLPTPKAFDTATADVPAEALLTKLFISDSLRELLGTMASYAELGFDRVFLHYLGRNTPEFVELAGDYLKDIN